MSEPSMENFATHRRMLEQDGVILYFRGPVTQSVVEGIGEMMRRKLSCEDMERNVTMNVFAVVVEQLQNVINYSAERCACDMGDERMGFGELIIGRRDGDIYVICGNQVAKDIEPRLEEKLKAVQGLSREELRQAYKAARRHGPDELSRGAGLGFIEMARRAKRPLDYAFEPQGDESSYFSVLVLIQTRREAS